MSEPGMTCPNCQKEFRFQVSTCSNCGYPFSETEAVRLKFIDAESIKTYELKNANENLNTTKIILFIAAAFITLEGIWFYMSEGGNPGDEITMAGAFVLFGIYLKKSPLLCIITPLAMLITYHAIVAIEYPETAIHTYKDNALPVIGLIYGLRCVLIADRYRKKYPYLNVNKERH